MNIPLKEYFEQRLVGIEKSIEELRTNHFFHLEKKVDKIIWLLITTLIAIIIHAVGVILKV